MNYKGVDFGHPLCFIYICEMQIIKKITLILLCFVAISSHRGESVDFVTYTLDNGEQLIITEDMLLGKGIDIKDGRWVLCNKNRYLLAEVHKAFYMMKEAAAKDGVEIDVRSGLRDFQWQKDIWNWKWSLEERASLNDKDRALDILKYSSMPGTSRHHWGTDVDINSLELAYWESEEGVKVYNWLVENGSKFGFFQPFKHSENMGYLEEKWHWSYSPLANYYYDAYLTLIDYKDIKGFKGAYLAEELDVINRWIKFY